MSIEIRQSKTADTRTCDVSKVSRQQLLESSVQHIGDVGKALAFFSALLTQQAVRHDTDKLTDIDSFYTDFLTKFEQTGWWDRHRALNRHHLTAEDGIPLDVNLIDVLDFIEPGVNHIDFDTINNAVANLEWCTQAENIQHSAKAGRMNRPEMRGKRPTVAAFTDEQVAAMRQQYATGGETWSSLAAKFGVSKRTVGRILRREVYSYV